MTLKDLSFSGLKHVMESEEYKGLFDGGKDDKPALTSMDLKLLELRLELFIWDRREGFATWVSVVVYCLLLYCHSVPMFGNAWLGNIKRYVFILFVIHCLLNLSSSLPWQSIIVHPLFIWQRNHRNRCLQLLGLENTILAMCLVLRPNNFM